jgi:hypothetical protein
MSPMDGHHPSYIVVPEVTRDEIGNGWRIVARPAKPAHANYQGELLYVLRAHIAPGYAVSKGNLALRARENTAVARGETQGTARLLLLLLEEKFGPLDPESREWVQAADADQLLAWGARLLRAQGLHDVFGR